MEKLFLMVFIISGDIQVNPGPSTCPCVFANVQLPRNIIELRHVNGSIYKKDKCRRFGFSLQLFLRNNEK